MAIERQLFSGENACLAGCGYCFAKWPDYFRQPVLGFSESSAGESVIYPCCDSDISDNPEGLQKLWEMVRQKAKAYISLSVKRAVAAGHLAEYKKLDQYLRENRKGFVKISVPLTSKYKIEQLEPGTDGYDQRKAFFLELQRQEFACSLIFKPVLPFVPEEEYEEIVGDFSSCRYFLLGGLYVHEQTEFYRDYIQGRYPVEERSVSWLEGSPCWNYVPQEEKLHRIERYIVEQGREVFYSDVDLIARLTEEEDK